MRAGDWITLVGVLVAAAAIAVPPVLHHRAERDRQRAKFRSRIQSFATTAYVVLTQKIDVSRGVLTGAAPGLDEAMLHQLRVGAEDVAAAIDEGADSFTAELRAGATDAAGAERRVGTWYQMLADVRISVARPNTTPGEIAGVAALSYCCAHIALWSIEKTEESGVQEIIAVAASLPGIGERIDHYVRTLAPELAPEP